MTAPRPWTQVAAVVRFALRGAVNSLRRQGRGALVVFPVLLVFLLVELGRFGARASRGMLVVLTRLPPEQGAHYVARWLLALSLALVALKYARVVPGRGARRMFDTPLFRGLPMSPATRAACELAAATAYAAGFAAVLFVPAAWGAASLHLGAVEAVARTATATLAVNLATACVAYALHEGFTRTLSGRGLDLARTLAAVAGVGLVGAFVALGPIAAAGPRVVVRPGPAPPWAQWLPTRSLAAWLLGEGGALPALAPYALVTVAALAAVAWRLREPGDLALDAPRAPWGAPRWEAALGHWRAELRMLTRQVPWLPLGAPAFLAFFLLLLGGAKRATGAEMPLLALTGLTGWASVVMGTALAGAAARRWRRVLAFPLGAGVDHRASVRAVALAHTALVAPLAIAPLGVYLQGLHPVPWWSARMVLGVVAALGVGQWVQSGAVFLQLDPAPDRLSGLSVGALFGVLFASAPTAALVVVLSAVPLGTWLALLGLEALCAWSIERAATERLRWVLDPDGDPDADRRAWPALRTFGFALVAQALASMLLQDILHASFTASLVAGYGVFAGVVIPLSARGVRVHPREPRWPRGRALVLGALAGAGYFTAAALYARWASGGASAAAGPLTRALREASWGWKLALVPMAALLGPVIEELFFRGWLLPALRFDLPRRLAPWAFVLTAVVFALLHAGEAWPAALSAGLLAGALVERSGRLEASVALHVTANALAVTSALWPGLFT